MSLNVGELVATMRLDDAAFRRSIQQAPQQVQQGLQGAERAGEQAGERTGTAFGNGLKKLMGAAAAAAAGVGLVDFLMSAKDAASDLNETVSKAGTIFGSNYGKVEQWSKTAATSLGLSQSAALAAAAGFGDMFLQLGIAEGKAVDMSTAVVQMAADFGSFNNLDTAEVLDMISGAMKGEYDSIQAVLPNISAARVEHEALAMSGKSVASELTAADKAMAVMSIATQDGTRAMGDYARTASSTANTEKTLAAQWEQTQAAIGQKLLPAWNAFLSVLGLVIGAVVPIADAIEGLVQWIMDLPGPLIVAAAALAGWAIAGTIAGYVSVFAASVGTAALAVKGFMASLGPIGLLIVGVGTAFSFLMDEAENTEAVIDANAARWERFKGTLDSTTGAVTDATRALVAQEAQSSGLLTQMEQLGVSTSAFVDASTNAAGGADALATSVSGAARAAVESSSAYKAVESDLRAAGVSQAEFIAALKSGDLSGIEAQIAAYGEGVARSTGNVSAGTEIQSRFQAAVAETSGPLQTLAGILAIAGADSADFAAAGATAAQAAEAVGVEAEAASPPMENLAAATDEMESASSGAETATRFLMAALTELSGGAVEAETASRNQAAAIREVAASARDVAQAQADQAAAAEASTAATNEFGAGSREAAEAQRNYDDAVDAVADALDSQYESSVKTRDGAVQMAGAAFDAALKNGTLEDASRAANAVIEDQRAKFLNASSAADRESGAAQELANKLFGIPGEVETAIRENGAGNVKNQAQGVTDEVNEIPDSNTTSLNVADNATRVVQNLAGELRALNGYSAWTTVGTRYVTEGNPTTKISTPGTGGQHLGGVPQGLPAFAGGGGATPNVGPWTVDGLLARVHRNEHVWDSGDVDRMGGQAAVYSARAALTSGGPEAMARSILSRSAGAGKAMAPRLSAGGSSGPQTVIQFGDVRVGEYRDAQELLNRAAYMGVR